MSITGYRVPQQQSFRDTMNFLVWDQFPVMLEKSVEYFAAIPTVGVYQQVRPQIKPFKEALLNTTGRQFTISGIGSLFDYDKFGHQIKRPVPQLQGGACSSNSLCLQPTCFGFTEGVIESNNVLQDMCWSLSMPCLKDMYYSDMRYEDKMQQYFAMFFQQPSAVLQAYQRTRLIKEAVKVVCTARNYRYSGPVIGGTDGISLPFYIDPVNPFDMPDLSALPGGVGGANLSAFVNFVAPRMFAGDAFTGGVQDVKVYGLRQDMYVAKEQTASVQDHYYTAEILANMRANGMSGIEGIERMLGTFIEDPMFPTFKMSGGDLIPITQEILEPSTIAGYVQTSNPEHALAQIRGLLFVPSNWQFSLVEPPEDDFSFLGLGDALNFRTNSPGNFPIMSSSMFSKNKLGPNGVVQLGDFRGIPGTAGSGRTGISMSARDRAIREAVRTEVLFTYSDIACNNSPDGQLHNVGQPIVPQGAADGFRLKSTMYVGTDVKGTAKPVLLLFKTDTPRSARPIEVCTIEEIEVDTEAVPSLVSCCPGNQNYVVLTFSSDISADYTLNDRVVYRTGPKGSSYAAEVTAVSGSVLTIQSTDDPAQTLPCCSGPDQYGFMGDVINLEGATATCSEIMKATYDDVTSSIFIETFDPIVGALNNAAATITLQDGTVIDMDVVGNTLSGVFWQVDKDAGETFDIATLDCACLVNATLCIVT